MTDQNAQRAGGSAGAVIRLRVLATSDLHANLYPYDYYADVPSDTVGLSRVASLVARMRAEEENCVLLDNGDTLQGTPLGDYAALEREDNGRPHPVIMAMNTLGYDAATLGNHDFNFGIEALERALADAAFPVVLANVCRADGTDFVPKSVLLKRGLRDSTGALRQVTIGVIGFTPPQILKWDRQILEGRLLSAEILDAARAEVPRLRAAGAEVVIALCHSGIGPEGERPDLENAIVPLAGGGEVDAIVAGHTHSRFPADPDGAAPWADHETGAIKGVPVVQPGFWGSHLGVIDLSLVPDGEGWRVGGGTGRLLPVADDAGRPAVANSQAILRVSAADHMATLGYIRRRIGETAVPLSSYFALTGNTPAIQVVADAQRAAAESLLENHPLCALPLLSAAAPFKAGGRGGPTNYTDIPAGPLSIRSAADLYIFPNGLQILQASGAQIADWLERVAAAFHRIEPGKPGQPLIDHAFAGYNFDVIDGLSYEIDVSVPARTSADGETAQDSPGRIRELCHQGRPVAPDDSFLIATNSYRAAGGGHFAAAAACTPIISHPASVRDVLIRHIAANSPLNPDTRPTWRFAPLGGTEAIVETGSGALNHPDLIAAAGLRHAGTLENGFAQFLLTL